MAKARMWDCVWPEKLGLGNKGKSFSLDAGRWARVRAQLGVFISWDQT